MPEVIEICCLGEGVVLVLVAAAAVDFLVEVYVVL